MKIALSFGRNCAYTPFQTSSDLASQSTVFFSTSYCSHLAILAINVFVIIVIQNIVNMLRKPHGLKSQATRLIRYSLSLLPQAETAKSPTLFYHLLFQPHPCKNAVALHIPAQWIPSDQRRRDLIYGLSISSLR